MKHKIQQYISWQIKHCKWTKKYMNIISADKNLSYLAKSITIAGFFKVAALPLWLITSVIISRWYGAEAMWLYSITITIISIITIVWLLGLGNAMPRFIGQTKASNTDHENARKVWRTAVQIILFNSVILTVLMLISAESISHIFHEPKLIFPLQITALFIIPLLWQRINTEYLLAQKQIRWSELISKLIIPISLLSIIIISFSVWHTYYIPIRWYLIAHTIWLAYSIYILYMHQNITLIWSKIPRNNLLKISIPMVVTWVAWLLMNKTDILMLWRMKDSRQVGIYQVIITLVSLIPIWLVIVGSVLKPQIAELYRSNQKQELQTVITASNFVTSIIAIVCFLVLMIFPSLILSLWWIEFVNSEAIVALRILSIGFLIHCLCGNNGFYMNSTGKEKAMQVIVIIVSMINILLNFILIPWYGLIWAALASLVTIILFSVSASWYIWKKDKIKTFIWVSYNK